MHTQSIKERLAEANIAMTKDKEEIRSETVIQRENDLMSLIAATFAIAITILLVIGLCFLQLMDSNKNLKVIQKQISEINKKMNHNCPPVYQIDPNIATNWIYEYPTPKVVPVCNYEHVSPTKGSKK